MKKNYLKPDTISVAINATWGLLLGSGDSGLSDPTPDPVSKRRNPAF